MLRLRLGVLAFVTLATLFTAPLRAQTAGRISGTVHVSSGAPVGGAPLLLVAVTVTNQQTGASTVTRTSSAGTYEVGDLAPGLYTVSAEVQGFRKASKKDVNVDAGATVTVDFSLEAKFAAEVTVTAMKREDTVENTPVSVAAPTEGLLRDRGVENVEDVAANVPGFSVQNLGPGQSQVAMRGVSSGQIARDQPGVKEQVGAYLDESVLSMSLFTPDIDLFDVGRVEVLRGPQGTLFGSGSESGTVRYISNQPDLTAVNYFGELSGSLNGQGAEGGTAKAGFNLPLGKKAALRLVEYYDKYAGYIDAVQPRNFVKPNVNGGYRAGFRAALAIAPIDGLTITPRVVYQSVSMDGWNRVDLYNILANPYTTTRPKVFLGDRQQFTQIGEPFTDKFFLGDLTGKYDLGAVTLTSITSYTKRDILVVRDAGALTSSITGGSIGLPESVYTLDAPLNDATEAHGWSEELRASGGTGPLKWVLGIFYTDSRRNYGQSLHVGGFEAATDIPTAGAFGAGTDVLYYSDLHYKLRQFALFGEATYSITPRFDLTAGLRYYNFKESRVQTFDGIFADPGTSTGEVKANGVAPRFIASLKVTDSVKLNLQAAKGFRLGGINDPLNLPLCSPEDKVTFAGRDQWDDESAWNYEIGAKTTFMGGRGSLNASAFYDDIKDLQVTVTAGTCSSRLIYNVPKARSVGGELELTIALDDHFDFAISAGYADAKLRSTVTSTDAAGQVTVISGIEEGRRLPAVPKFQASASATYQTDLKPGWVGYATGTWNHVGSRYTQVGDETSSGVVNLLSFAPNTIGGPLTQNTFTFDPLLPAYDIANVRIGVRHGVWDVALFCNNVTDEKARLALDRERGLRARVGYLTNPPRTFGINTRFDF